jgi:hypothetical protein
VEGKAVVSPILEALSSADEDMHNFLVQVKLAFINLSISFFFFFEKMC